MFTATADSRWTATELDAMKSIPVSSLRVVTPAAVLVPAMPQATAADLTGLVKAFPPGDLPTVSAFTWENEVLSWRVTGATYIFIDKIGLVRGTSVAAPSDTYTLTASNPYGRTVATLK